MPAVQRLQRHLRQGDTVVLLSGTLEPIARALARASACTHVRATVCRERDGRYLAGPPKMHPFGAAKLELATQLAAEIGADLRAGERVRRLAARLDACSRPSATPSRCVRIAPLLDTARGNRWQIIRRRNARRVLPH